LIVPSSRSYGLLFGLELPPLKALPESTPVMWEEPSRWRDEMVVNGKKITGGDLNGYMREDPLLGYTHLESTISANGWWQSNNIGARKRTDTKRSKSVHQKRVLVFGESFAHGSCLRQEETWAYLLEEENPRLEVVNFGVDGYSMAQSFLRYQTVRSGGLDYDLVFLVFVPREDLWRDLNTVRFLADEHWRIDTVLPRFTVGDEKLRLIRSPYQSMDELFEKNNPDLSDELRHHLEDFDRFYFAQEHAKPTFIRKTVLFRLGVRAYFSLKRKMLFESSWELGSEAVEVSNKIFTSMNQQVQEDGKLFALVCLPTEDEVIRRGSDAGHWQYWNRLINRVSHQGFPCLDLSVSLREKGAEHLDRGYDGTHHGPKTNRLIAEVLGATLRSWGY